MKYNVILAVVLCFACGFLLKDGHAAPVSQDMSIFELSVLDGYLQMELIQLLQPDMDREVQKYNMLFEMCEIEVNKTVDECIKCADSASCGGSESGGKSPGVINIAMNVAKSVMGPMLDHKMLLLGGATGAITKATLGVLMNKQTLKTMGNLGKTIGKGFSSAYKGISKGLSSAYKDVKSGISKAYKGAKNTVNKAYNGVKSGFKSAGNAIKSGFSKVFGKRDESESMDPCVLKSCESCRRIDTDTKTSEEIVNDVCKSVLEAQKASEAKIVELEHQMMSVYEKSGLIISKLSYDFIQSDALSGNWNFQVSEVKAALDGKSIPILPTMTVNVNDLASVAKTMAQRIYDHLNA